MALPAKKPPGQTVLPTRRSPRFRKMTYPLAMSDSRSRRPLERSLRPRKPIQQHPYLLESAQYATVMKSHGVRPVRVNVETDTQQRRAEDEDSQEQDFVAEEESQENPTNPAPGTSPLRFHGDSEQDELAPSPSPPKTSPTGAALRTSSQPNDDDTLLTNFSDDDDEDLPSLDQLLRQPANPRVRRLKRQGSQLLSSRRKRQNRLPDSSQESLPPRPLIVPPNIWDLSSSPPELHAQHDKPSQVLGDTPSARPRPWPGSPSSLPTSALPSSARPPRVGTATAPLMVEDGSSSESDSSSSSGSSSSESEVIRKTV
jgi:hypothetical protein